MEGVATRGAFGVPLSRGDVCADAAEWQNMGSGDGGGQEIVFDVHQVSWLARFLTRVLLYAKVSVVDGRVQLVVCWMGFGVNVFCRSQPLPFALCMLSICHE